MELRRPRASDEDAPVIPPAPSVTVDEPDRRPVLYDSTGKPLVKRPAGFDTGHKKVWS